MATSSNYCGNCGSNNFRLEEGYYFCNQCGTQQASRREVEHEISNAFIKIGKKMTKTKGKKEKEVKTKERTQKLHADPYICERAMLGDDYPRWLDAIGTRLCTASKLMAKISQTMVQDFRAPPDCVNYCRHLFYTYMAKAGIAFCEQEIANDGENATFCPIIKYTIAEIKAMKAERKKTEMEREKRIKKQLFDSSTVWEQISFREEKNKPFDDNIDWDKVEEGGAREAERPIDVFGRIETKLTIEAINRASTIYLGMDLLLCMVYLASQLAGCQWILLSDIFRWYREGRFNISHTQHCALDFATSWAKDREEGAAFWAAERRFYQRSTKTGRGIYIAVQPTSESFRVLAFLTQHIAIPRSLKIMDFKKMLARFVYNLNLPRQFLQNLFALLDYLLPVNSNIDQEYFSHIQPLDPGLYDRLSWACTNKHSIGYSSFLERAFLPNHRQLPWDRRGVVQREGQNTEQLYLEGGTKWHFVSLPMEVKAAAIILFGLKLFFGLDGEREYQMRPKRGGNDQQNRAHPFDFPQWLAQLEQRTYCWQGTTAKVVLGKSFKGDQMERTEPNFPTTRFSKNIKGRVIGRGGTLFGYDRNDQFSGCVPNTVFNRVQPKLCEELFPTHFKYNAAQDLGIQMRNNPQMEKEALFTPLQYQATCMENTLDDQSNLLDKNRVHTFLQRFYDSHLDLELTAGDDDEEMSEVDKENCNENAAIQFHKLFPCSDAYQRLPPIQKFKCFAIVFPRIDEKGFVLKNQSTNIPSRLKSIPISPILMHRQIKRALQVAEYQFSPSFCVLLRHFALSIAETDHLLYFAFLMVESMFFDRKDFARFEQDFRLYGRTTFHTKQIYISSKNPVRFQYSLELDKFGNENKQTVERKNAKLYEFRYKISRAKIFHARKWPNQNGGDIQNEEEEEKSEEEDEEKEEEKRIRRLIQQGIIFQDQQKSQNQIGESANVIQCGDEENNTNNEDEEDSDEDDSTSISSDSSIDLDMDGAIGDENSTGNVPQTIELDPAKKQFPVRLMSLPPVATFALCSLRQW